MNSDTLRIGLMRIRRDSVLGLALSLLALGTAQNVGAQACAPSNDTTQAMLAHLKVLAASNKPTDGYARRDLKIPAADSATVVAVTQNQTCQKALAAFNSTIQGYTPLPTRVYLAKVGTVYVAMNPLNNDHYWPYAVLDSKYKVLSKYAR